MTFLIIHHPDIAKHDEASAVGGLAAGRIEAVVAAVVGVEGVQEVRAKPVAREALGRVHTEGYLDALDAWDAEVGHNEVMELDMDTHVNAHTLRAAMLSVGAAVQGVEAVVAGVARHVVCPVLAGHHAGPDTAEGFCVLNAAAVAALHAKALGKRVAVLDFDTHSGNGTIAALEGVEGVMVVETYQAGYPGPVEVHGGNVLRALVGGPDTWRAVWESYLRQVAAFGAEVLVVSAGFDGHRDDPLGRIGLDDGDFEGLFEGIKALGVPTVAVLEGGYNVPTTARLARRWVEVMGL
ncbi:MAG: hypothetical protein WAZ18_05660 [Alphaproteobacteria bacterium]